MPRLCLSRSIEGGNAWTGALPRPLSMERMAGLRHRLAGSVGDDGAARLDGVPMSGQRGREWEALPLHRAAGTLQALCAGSDPSHGSGVHGDVCYVEGSMPLVLALPCGGMRSIGPKDGGGAAAVASFMAAVSAEIYLCSYVASVLVKKY
jgi:hypothetical protein